MLIRNALIHSIRKIKEFLRKDIGEDYERLLTKKFMYEGTTVSHRVVHGDGANLDRRLSAMTLSPGSAPSTMSTDAPVREDAVPPVATDAVPPVREDAVPPVAADAVPPVREDAVPPVAKDAVPSAAKDAVEVAVASQSADRQVPGERELAGALAALNLDVSDKRTVAATSAMHSSPVLLMSHSARGDVPAPAFASFSRSVDSQRLRNGESWGAMMAMDLDSFRRCYLNTLKSFDLEDIKRLILIRFVRALEQIESNARLLDLELKTLVDIQVTEAMDLLSYVRDGAAYKPLPGIKLEHGPGESEFHVMATSFTLEQTKVAMRSISSEQYKLPCDIFELTNDMLNSKNVLLLALNTGFGYLAQSFFYESRALAIQAKYSSYSLTAQYCYFYEMQFLPELAQTKRQHWMTTNNNLKSALDKAQFSKEGALSSFPGGETAYLQAAEAVIKEQQRSAALLRRNKTGTPERLDRSYDVFVTDLARRYQSRVRVQM